jgi:undecaprenyl-diphosphatase
VLSSSHDRAVAATASAAFVAGACVARRGRVSTLEARWFEAANGLSHAAYVPVWMLMQFGSLGGALATGAALRVSGRPALGDRVAAVGAATWVAAKAVKPFVRRGRPAHTVTGVRVRGAEQSGLGYPSGHAAVSAALAAVVTPCLPRRWRVPVWAGALAVGPTRSYVGAHLPLDVVGGAALGIAIGAVARAPAPGAARGVTRRG